MEKFVGKWKSTTIENFDNLMKELGNKKNCHLSIMMS